MTCLLCLESTDNKIEIFSKEGVQQNICSIIAKHLWIQPIMDLLSSQVICIPCWDAVRSFHKFYQKVEEAHQRLDTKIALTEAEDPLPLTVVLKSEIDPTQLEIPVPLHNEHFFDSEIKMEVRDLELLPPIEIIDELEDCKPTSRTRRSTRRTRQKKETPERENKKGGSSAAKRIKREKSSSIVDEDSESEIPLSNLLEVQIKCDPIEDEATVESSNNKEAKLLQSENVTKKTSDTTKKEDKGDDTDDQDDNDYQPAGTASGTEDSASSSSSESGESIAADTTEKYAVIPKRVVMKPKKYKKRQKPLVPPRKIPREELDRLAAIQESYDRIIKENMTKLVCTRCSLLVVDFDAMKKHFRAAHDDRGFIECCGKKYFQRKGLVDHIYVHLNPEHFKCSKCDKILQDSRTLEAHEASHDPSTVTKVKKTFQCDKCPKTYASKATLEHHVFSRHVPKDEFQFECKECGKKCPTAKNLRDHMKYIHDPESAIICDKCGKVVRNQASLKKHHELEHSDVPRPAPVPMQCDICGTWLRHLAGLKQHMKTIHADTGVEHRCHICSKVSTTARALKRHIYHNHECERKFKCTMCEKAFKRPQDLREHTSTHTGEVLYTCPNCPMTFFSSANMYKHRQRLHRQAWEADRKKPLPPNTVQAAVAATAAMRFKQAVKSASTLKLNQ